jgi:hypothetical protein
VKTPVSFNLAFRAVFVALVVLFYKLRVWKDGVRDPILIPTVRSGSRVIV